MKRLALLFGLFSSTVLAQTTPGPATYVQIRTAPTVGAACTTGQTVWVPSTRRSYCCVGALWTACDAPADCAANPPTGACSTGQTCARTDTSAIYSCVSSAWVAITPTVTGATGTVQESNGSNGLQPSAIALSADFDGNGTAASADLNGDGTVDDSGYASTSSLRAPRLWSSLPVSGSYNPDGSGVVDPWTPNTLRVSSIVAARAHGALYGEPDYYVRPGVYDAYLDVFLGHPLYADCDNDGTAGGTSGNACGAASLTRPLISQCGQNSCGNDLGIICVTSTDATANGLADTNADGTVDFAVGDVVTFSASASKSTGGKAYVITAIANGAGAGTNCPAGTDNFFSVGPTVDQNTISGPDTDASGAVDSNMALARVWANNSHYSHEGAHFLGYRLGYASRLLYGTQGPNLLRNGNMDYDATTENWTPSTGSLAGNGFTATPSNSTANYNVFEGGTSAAIWFNTSTSGATIESSDTYTLHPGERYVLSGLIMARNADTIGLSDDRDQDSTYAATTEAQIALTALTQPNNFGFQEAWLWTSFEAPESVHRFKVRFTKGGTSASSPQIDGWELRRVTTWQTDSWAENENGGTVFLINDPGDRCINLTGDSWATSGTAYSNVRIGLADAMAARYSGKTSSQWQTQIILSGVAGYTAENILDNWYSLVEKYDCLYTVFFVSTNDITGAVAQATWTAQIQQIAQRAMMAGTIPIFISPAPLGPAGDAKMTTARQFKDAERRLLLQAAP